MYTFCHFWSCSLTLTSVFFKPFGKVAPQGWKRTNTGSTQTIAIIPAEPEIPWRISHPSIIPAECCLTPLFELELVYPKWQIHWLINHKCFMVPSHYFYLSLCQLTFCQWGGMELVEKKGATLVWWRVGAIGCHPKGN